MVLFHGLSHEDAVAPNDGGRIARPGQGRMPANVLIRAPGQRKILFRCHACSLRTPPSRPIFRSGWLGDADEYEQAREYERFEAFHNSNPYERPRPSSQFPHRLALTRRCTGVSLYTMERIQSVPKWKFYEFWILQSG